MRLKKADKPSGVDWGVVLPGGPSESHDLLSALFHSSILGLAICDRQFRYRAINDALAAMNGRPAADHLGRTLDDIIGSAAEVVRAACAQVFATGQPMSNFEVTAQLPGHDFIGHWDESYFPIRDKSGSVTHVGVIVLELARRKEIDAALLKLTENLSSIGSTLNTNGSGREAACRNTVAPDAGSGLTHSLELLQNCMADASSISKLLNCTPPLPGIPRRQPGSTRDEDSTKAQAESRPRSKGARTTAKIEFPLSEREREVAALLANGKTNKQVASVLRISTRTVEGYRSRIMLKLNLCNLGDLVRYALRTKIVKP